MARRRKHKKRTHRRRGRMGALALNASSPVVRLGSIGLGFLMAGKINPMIDKVTSTMDPKLVGGLQTGLGAALAFNLITKKKSVPLTVVGGVLAGSGAKRLLSAFGIMNGYGNVNVIAGYQNAPVLAGFTPNVSLNGYRTAPVAVNGKTSSSVMGSMSSNGGGSDLVG